MPTRTPPPFSDLPTFWPAAVPNKILTQQAYQRILQGGLSPADRETAFATRVPWARHLAPDYQTRINEFVTEWFKLGIIEQQPGPTHDPAFPSVMHVEQESGYPERVVPRQAMLLADAAGGGAPAPEDLPSQPLLDDWRAHL
jgi:hypothetical protein